MELCHDAVALRFEREEIAVSAVEFLLLHVLLSVGLHHADAEQAVLDLGVELADLLARGGKVIAHTCAKIEEREDHEGNEREDDQRKPRTHCAENDEGTHDLDARNKEFLGAVVCKLGHVKEIVGDAGHQRAHLGVVVIGEGELLQMRKEIVTHIVLDLRSHDVADRGHVVVGGGVDHAEHHVKEAAPQDQIHGQGGEIFGGRLGDAADDHGQHQLADRRQSRAEKIRQHDPFVFFVVGQKALDQPKPAFRFLHQGFLRKVSFMPSF